MLKFQNMTCEEVVGVPRELFDQHYYSQLLGYYEQENYAPVIYRSLVGLKTHELIPKVRMVVEGGGGGGGVIRIVGVPPAAAAAVVTLGDDNTSTVTILDSSHT